MTHANYFQSPRMRNFLREYVRRIAAQDRLRIFQIIIGGEVVATRLGFLMGDEVYLYYSGYSPPWGRYSVMTTVTVEAIRWSFGAGVRIVNLSTGSDYAKRRWLPLETVSSDYRVWSPAMPRHRTRGRIIELLRRAPEGSMLGRAVAMVRRAR